MKKLFLIAVAACVALASCTKNEVAPTDPQEITYQAIVGKSTKALIGNTAYPEGETFGTVAYKVDGGTSELYIPISEVSYNTTDKYWSTETPYYWPKDGSTLTFYSYSPFKDNSDTQIPDVSSTEDGLTIANYSVASAARQLTDLMVADKVTGLTDNNETIGSWKEDVSTVFRHKLAQVVAINFQTVDANGTTVKDYANGRSHGSCQPGDKIYTITDVTFKAIPEQGTYTNAGTEGWTTTGTATPTIPWISGNTTPFTGGMFDTTRPTNGYLLVIPQTFAASNQQLTINYTVKTYTGASTFATETIERTVDLSTLHTAWEMNKKYTYTISIGLNRIYWAPSVVAWDETGTGSATI